MTRANRTRASVCSPVDWEDTGRSAWARIRAALEQSPERQELIHALSEYANDTHWAHTFLGLVAVEKGQLLEAGTHLLSSVAIWAEPRTSAYGPSLLLASKLCEAGMWRDVEQFLISSKDPWDNEILDEWLKEVRSEHTPVFDEA